MRRDADGHRDRADLTGSNAEPVGLESPGPPRVTVIGGGLGSARLALGLQAAGLEAECCFVTNVGDDVDVGGLLVCPDTDAVVYALAGIFDDERGWGIRGDHFDPPRPGEPSWFHLGRRDRVHHLRRRRLLDEGRTVSEATATLALSMGIAARIVPATDDRLRTRIRIDDRRLDFQEWLVREHAGAVPDEVDYAGATHGRPAPGVLEAIADAELVVFASSSPVASLGPTLAVPCVVDTLRARVGATVAVSPVVARRACATERDQRRARARAALLAGIGVDHSPVGVARWMAGLGDLVDHFVLDPADAEDAASIRRLGFDVMIAPVVGGTSKDRTDLVDAVVELSGHRRGRRRRRGSDLPARRRSTDTECSDEHSNSAPRARA